MLFDLDTGPGELHNLAPPRKDAQLLALWKGRPVEPLTGRGEGFVHDGPRLAGPRWSPCPPTPVHCFR